MAGRWIRALADGFVSVVLAQYLTDLGLSPFEVGAIVTGTLLGSAALTLVFGLVARRSSLGQLLVAAAVLMVGTGLGFGLATAFWPLLVVAVVGTLNPSSGDVSVFLPTEQAYLANHSPAGRLTQRYAVYNLGAALAGAVGALASGLPSHIAEATGWRAVDVERAGFVAYGVAGLVILALYAPLPRREAAAPRAPSSPPLSRSSNQALGPSRPLVLRLALLFSLDSAGGGFVVTSLLVLWLHIRFDLSGGSTAAIFFAAGLLGASSQLLAPILAARFGLVRTMVFTHLPASALLALAAFAPNGTVAVVLLLARALCSQMDVPARQSFVMAVVPPEARAAASSVTNVPRSLAAATTPLLAGALLDRSTFGWPLLIAGSTKVTYDLLLLALHRNTAEAPLPRLA